MNPETAPTLGQIAEQRRAAHRVALGEWTEAAPLLDALEGAGIDTSDFGLFDWTPSAFDARRAVGILLDWLPRIDDPRVKETVIRYLAGQPTARGEGVRLLLAEFHRPEYRNEVSLRWTIGDVVASLASKPDADAIIEILREPSHGIARQRFCDALVRTKDSRRMEVLIELIPDRDVGGHAILAMRRSRGLSDAATIRPLLEAVKSDPSASDFARKQAQAVLKKMG